MLKNSPPLEVMLAHRSFERVDGLRDQGVDLLQLAKGQMEGFFVSVQMLIVEIGILIEPHAEAERRPAASFLNDHLAGFKFRFLWGTQSAALPDCQGLPGFSPAVIGPENCCAGLELRRVEKELGINHRDVVRVQQQNFAKGRL
ncbi:MAG: hypothetical protein ABSD29_14210, partial [Verrucomicrobiota bacterium]